MYQSATWVPVYNHLLKSLSKIGKCELKHGRDPAVLGPALESGQIKSIHGFTESEGLPPARAIPVILACNDGLIFSSEPSHQPSFQRFETMVDHTCSNDGNAGPGSPYCIVVHHRGFQWTELSFLALGRFRAVIMLKVSTRALTRMYKNRTDQSYVRLVHLRVSKLFLLTS